MKKYLLTVLMVAGVFVLLGDAFSATLDLGGQKMLSSSFQRETKAYLALPNVSMTSAQGAALDSILKSLKYVPAYTHTIASATVGISNVASYYFLTNPTYTSTGLPSNDLRWVPSGYTIRLTDTSAKVKTVLKGANGTGETYTDIISGNTLNGNMETGDPPTGWSVDNGSTLSSVADERTGGSGSKSMNAVRGTASRASHIDIATSSTGKLYKASGWGKNGTAAAEIYLAATTRFCQGAGTWTFGSGYRTSLTSIMSVDLYASGSAGQTARFDDVYAGQVLTPSLTGTWYTTVSEDAGYNPNTAQIISVSK